jgi:signal transduction histidine kinase
MVQLPSYSVNYPILFSVYLQVKKISIVTLFIPVIMLLNFLNKIRSTGIGEDMDIQSALRLRLTNTAIFVSVPVYIFLLFFSIKHKIYFISYAAGFLLSSCFLILWLTGKRKYVFAKFLLLCPAVIFIFTGFNILNVGISSIALYFPIMTLCAILFDTRRELKAMFITQLITITAIILSFAVPKYSFGEVILPEKTIFYLNGINYAVSFFLFLVYVYMIIYFNALIENKMRAALQLVGQQKEAANKAQEKAEQAVEIKTKFLSNMSHELRTPLNGIIGTANLLLHETSMPEQKQHFNLLKYSSEHMLSLINDVLDFSKIEAGKMQLEKSPFNLKEFFSKIENLFAGQFSSKGVALVFNIDEKLNRFFTGDETRLSQVLCNLIANALKFTQQGGVTVTAILEMADSQAGKIYFSVKDTGIGITTEQGKIIFESFIQGDTTTTRKFGGTGLGLSISKYIVELYNSELQVESLHGKGSNFFFTIQLNLHMENKSFVNEKILQGLVSLKGLKVLVAEDNAINMIIAKRFLEKWDVTMDEAVNGIEALKKFAEHEYDLLLIDLEMPEMDGYKTIKEIRKNNSKIPAIAFTAAVYDNMEKDLLNHGFNGYIQKPFRPEDLHRKLSSYTRLAD